MPYTDRVLTCRDCGRSFTFTAGEQEFFASRGFEHPPSRCAECRAVRRAGGGNGTPAARTDDRSPQPMREPRELFPAVCSQCGAETQVSFQPVTSKPVYCGPCFSEHRRAR